MTCTKYYTCMYCSRLTQQAGLYAGLMRCKLSLFTPSPPPPDSSRSTVPSLSNSKRCDITASSEHRRLPCLFRRLPSAGRSLLFSSLLHSRHLPQRHRRWRVSCLRRLSLWFPTLSIQRKVRREGIVVAGTNIDKCYCRAISRVIYIHMGGSITCTAQRHGCQNTFGFKERLTQVICSEGLSFLLC